MTLKLVQRWTRDAEDTGSSPVKDLCSYFFVFEKGPYTQTDVTYIYIL